MRHRGSRVRAGGVLTAGGLALVLVVASAAWGCASIASLEFATASAKAGEEVAFKVVFVHKDRPVTIHWDAIDGPVLTTVTPDTFTEGLHGNWRFAPGSLTIPADAKPGTHILVANQEAHRDTALWGMPARGAIEVLGEGGTPPAKGPAAPPTAEAVTLVKGAGGPGVGQLVLVGLGAAGVAMFVAGLAFALRGSGRPRPAVLTAEGRS